MSNKSHNIFCIQSNFGSGYGNEVLQEILSCLVKFDCTVLFGLFSQSDHYSLQFALKLGLKVKVFVPCGLKMFQKDSHNRHILQEVINCGGEVLSIFPKNSKTSYESYTKLGEYILSIASLVMFFYGEAESAATHLGQKALDLNIPVITFPGNIFSNSFQGNYILHKHGAEMVFSDLDIQDLLPLSN